MSNDTPQISPLYVQPEACCTDDIYTFQEAQPTQDFYWITHNDDGKAIYYKASMDEYHLYCALYGLPQLTKWTYTNHQADETTTF